MYLARILLEQGDLVTAEDLLRHTRIAVTEYQDRLGVASVHYVTSRLHILRGDIPAARASLAEAIDLFERLGMRRELAEARDELARLDAPAEPAPEAE